MEFKVASARLAFLTMLCVGFWFLSVTLAQVDAWLVSQRVATDLQSFRNLGESKPNLSVVQTQQAAEKAVKLNSNDADHAMNAGLVWFFAGHFADNRRDQRAAFKKAMAHYEKAVELRPAWPHHYRNLHDLYYLTLRPMEQRTQMLRQVAKYGKWKREIKYYLLERTLARPKSLPEDLKLVESQVVNYLDNKRDGVTQAKMADFRNLYPDSMQSAMHRASIQATPIKSSSFKD